MAEGVSDAELLEQVRQGRTADSLLADPTIARYFALVEQVIVAEWRATKTRDVESQAHWRRMLECHERLQQVFVEFIRTGRVAKEKLDNRSKTRRVYDAATRRFR